MDKKYIIDTEENKEYMKGLCDELLSFGHKFPAPSGASYYLGDDGTPWTDRPRETWITCRMTHVYSIGKMLGHKGSEKLAEAGINGLLTELADPNKGGWFAGVSSEGVPLPNKACYAHAFVILAGTSGVLAGVKWADKLLEEALAVYDTMFWDEQEGLAVDTWDTDFSVLDDYRGLNANMHTVEAFLAAADALGDDKYRVRAGRIIDRVVEWAQNNNWRIPEHFTKEWTADLECNKDRPDDPFKPYGATPGHGIEWGRLITQWAVSTFGEDGLHNSNKEEKTDGLHNSETREDGGGLHKYIEAAQNLYNQAIKDAWNADGAPGIVYTTDWEGKPVVHDRMHWTLAEAINTSAVLYRVTGKQKYADDYAMFLEYLEDKVHDKVNGSWFHQLDANNELMNTVWPGKSDIYHALQATLIPYQPVDVSIAKNIYNMQK